MSALALGSCGGDPAPAQPSSPVAPGSPAVGAREGLNGTWGLTRLSCDGVEEPLEGGTVTLTIDGSKGSLVGKDPSGCELSTENTYSFPSENTILVTDSATACVPAACSEVCGEPGSTTSWSYELREADLVLTRTAVEDDEDCDPGSVIRLEFDRQI